MNSLNAFSSLSPSSVTVLYIPCSIVTTLRIGFFAVLTSVAGVMAGKDRAIRRSFIAMTSVLAKVASILGLAANLA